MWLAFGERYGKDDHECDEEAGERQGNIRTEF